MKLAIPSLGKKLTSQISPRFGRSPYFLIIDPETNEFEVLTNPGTKAFRGAGVAASQLLANQQVKAVIAVNFGPRAFQALNASQIKTYQAKADSIKNILKKFKAEQLEQVSQATGPMAAARPRGRGRGANQ